MVAAPAYAAVAARDAALADAQIGSLELDPVIVTARRRDEDLQHTPVSVLAFDTNDLEARSLTNLRDLQTFVPTLTFAPSQNVGDTAGNMFIRGIGQEDFTSGTEAGVGLYVDDVYLARAFGILSDLVDVKRVEVLRGPQGTLFGRNTIGGAIQIVSTEPTPTPSARLDLIAADHSRLEAKVALNSPLASNLLARVSLIHAEDGGYMRRIPPSYAPTFFTESDTRHEGASTRNGVRAQLRWLLDSNWTADFALDATRRRGTQAATHVDAISPVPGVNDLPTVNRLIAQGILPGPPITAALVQSDLLASGAGGGNRIAQDFWGGSLNLVQQIDAHEIRLIGAARGLRSQSSTDLDGTPFTLISSRFDERQRQYSAELRASGMINTLAYTAGAFLFRERSEVVPVGGSGRNVLYFCRCFYTPADGLQTFYPARQAHTDSEALYAQATVPLISKLSVTAGLRRSRDRKRVAAQTVLLDPERLEPTDQILDSGSNRGRWKSSTWRASIEYHGSEAVMTYLSAATGFKSGGFNVRPSPRLANLGLKDFAPETALTYEAGIRSRWMGEHIQLNATVFHTNYRDIQLRQQTIVFGVIDTLIENAARARVRGIEIEAAARPTKGLALRLAYGHLDPQFLEIGRVPGVTLDSAFQRTPQHSLTVSADYTIPLTADRLRLHANYGYRSREQFQIAPSLWDQPGYALLGARVAWRAADDRWSMALFGTNLADQRYRVAGRANQLVSTGFAHSIIGMPRQVGLQFSVQR